MLYYGVSIVDFEQVNADWEEMTRLCPNYWQIHISSVIFITSPKILKSMEWGKWKPKNILELHFLYQKENYLTQILVCGI